MAYKGSTSQMSLFLLGLAGLIGTLILMRWPGLGLFILSFGGMLIPYSGPGGLNASMVIVGLLLVLWLGVMLFRERRIELLPSRTLRPVLALGFIAVSHSSWAKSPGPSLLGTRRWTRNWVV
jgi:hypothetical protein